MSLSKYSCVGPSTEKRACSAFSTNSLKDPRKEQKKKGKTQDERRPISTKRINRPKRKSIQGKKCAFFEMHAVAASFAKPSHPPV